MIKPHAYSIWPTVCVNFKIFIEIYVIRKKKEKK